MGSTKGQDRSAADGSQKRRRRYTLTIWSRILHRKPRVLVTAGDPKILSEPICKPGSRRPDLPSVLRTLLKVKYACGRNGKGKVFPPAYLALLIPVQVLLLRGRSRSRTFPKACRRRTLQDLPAMDFGQIPECQGEGRPGQLLACFKNIYLRSMWSRIERCAH